MSSLIIQHSASWLVDQCASLLIYVYLPIGEIDNLISTTMKQLAILVVLLACASADDDDVQLIKSVKGGHGRYQYNPGMRLYPNITQYPSYPGYPVTRNLTVPVDREVGVCYKEVPTASLARDPAHVPTGNGSRPDLSVIRSCCNGYIRNIHNFWICDPVCSQDCVNALCTAPETCTCFPEHVKNVAGFCIPTCPIGCQNGHCAGGECLCNEGYKLDDNRKYCVPKCMGNCGGIGNCTAPNTCSCKTGYQSTPEGTCKAICDHPCTNGNCVAPNVCDCSPGYFKDQRGTCIPNCPQGCSPNGRCVAPNRCEYPATTPKPTPIPYQPPNQHNGPSNSAGGSFYYPPSNGLSGNNQIPTSNQINGGHGQPNYPGQYNPGQNPNNHPNSPQQPHQQYPIYPDIHFTRPNQTNQQYPLNPDNQFYRPNNYNPYPDSQFYRPNQPNSQYPVNSNLHNLPNQSPEGLQCSELCLNGVCVEGNKCSCLPGYVPDITEPSGRRCVPYCASGCPNGICTAPNRCICNMGYVKDLSVKGRQVCVARARRSVNPALFKRLSFKISDL